MTSSIVQVLLIVVVTSGVLVSGKLRADLVAMLLLVFLGLSGLVPARDLFAGFSRPAVVTIVAICVITRALEKTGVSRLLGAQMCRVSHHHPAGRRRAATVATVSSAGALLSLLMNNIAAAAVLLPAVMGLSRQSGIWASRLLIPLSYGTLLGGMATLFTTANLLVSTALSDHGIKPYGILDFVPIGLPMAACGVLFMALVGWRLLPGVGQSGNQPSRDLTEVYGLKDVIHAVVVGPASLFAGRSLADSEWQSRLRFNVLGVWRHGAAIRGPLSDQVVEAGDIVLFTGPLDRGGTRGELSDYHLTLTDIPEGGLATGEVGLIEVTLPPRSPLAGRSLRELRFRDRFGMTVVALWREGVTLTDRIEDVQFAFGDALLVFGHRRRIPQLRKELLVLEIDTGPIRPIKALQAAAITMLFLGLATVNLIPVAEATFSAATFLLLVDCLTLEEAYDCIEWRAVVLVAGMLPLGQAISSTGTGAWLAGTIASTLEPGGFAVLAGGLFILVTLFTQVVGGQAAAVILSPIAISAALQVGADPRVLGMAVVMGCNMAFLTPFSHPSNLLVMGPGGYTMKDYSRVGLPLSGILFVVFMLSLLAFGRYI